MPLVTRTTTQGNIFKQDTEPDDKTDGSLWIDTSVDAPSLSVANGTTYKALQMAIVPGTTNVSVEAMV